MSDTDGSTTEKDQRLMTALLGRVCDDLAAIIDRPLEVASVDTRRSTTKAAGADQIHISHRLGFFGPDGAYHGCFLVPLPDAISMAASLMMVPDEAVAVRRSATDLDRATKDALLELADFIGGSSDAVVRTWSDEQLFSVRSEGCQGVRAGAPPNFVHASESELVVARARSRLHTYPEFELLAMVPAAVLDRAA